MRSVLNHDRHRNRPVYNPKIFNKKERICLSCTSARPLLLALSALLGNDMRRARTLAKGLFRSRWLSIHFDVDGSNDYPFLDEDTWSLHVTARTRRPSPPPSPSSTTTKTTTSKKKTTRRRSRSRSRSRRNQNRSHRGGSATPTAAQTTTTEAPTTSEEATTTSSSSSSLGAVAMLIDEGYGDDNENNENGYNDDDDDRSEDEDDDRSEDDEDEQVARLEEEYFPDDHHIPRRNKNNRNNNNKKKGRDDNDDEDQEYCGDGSSLLVNETIVLESDRGGGAGGAGGGMNERMRAEAVVMGFCAEFARNVEYLEIANHSNLQDGYDAWGATLARTLEHFDRAGYWQDSIQELVLYGLDLTHYGNGHSNGHGHGQREGLTMPTMPMIVTMTMLGGARIADADRDAAELPPLPRLFRLKTIRFKYCQQKEYEEIDDSDDGEPYDDDDEDDDNYETRANREFHQHPFDDVMEEVGGVGALAAGTAITWQSRAVMRRVVTNDTHNHHPNHQNHNHTWRSSPSDALSSPATSSFVQFSWPMLEFLRRFPALEIMDVDTRALPGEFPFHRTYDVRTLLNGLHLVAPRLRTLIIRDGGDLAEASDLDTKHFLKTLQSLPLLESIRLESEHNERRPYGIGGGVGIGVGGATRAILVEDDTNNNHHNNGGGAGVGTGAGAFDFGSLGPHGPTRLLKGLQSIIPNMKHLSDFDCLVHNAHDEKLKNSILLSVLWNKYSPRLLQPQRQQQEAPLTTDGNTNEHEGAGSITASLSFRGRGGGGDDDANGIVPGHSHSDSPSLLWLLWPQIVDKAATREPMTRDRPTLQASIVYALLRNCPEVVPTTETTAAATTAITTPTPTKRAKAARTKAGAGIAIGGAR